MAKNGEGSSKGNTSNAGWIEEPENSPEQEPIENPENPVVPMDEENPEEEEDAEEANNEDHLDLMQDGQFVDIEIEIEGEPPFPWGEEQWEAPVAPPPSEEELSDGETTEDEDMGETRIISTAAYRTMEREIEERRQQILELEAEVGFRVGQVQALEAVNGEVYEANNALIERNDALDEELVIYQHELHEVRGELHTAQNRITNLELEIARLRAMLPIDLNKSPSPSPNRNRPSA